MEELPEEKHRRQEDHRCSDRHKEDQEDQEDQKDHQRTLHRTRTRTYSTRMDCARGKKERDERRETRTFQRRQDQDQEIHSAMSTLSNHEQRRLQLRIGFILSLMTKGEASDWAEQYLESCLDQRNGTIDFPTFTVFLEEINRDFKQEDEVCDAANRLKSLKQGNRTAEELVTEFRLLVGKAGFKGNNDRDHYHLIEKFQEALNPRIALKILHSEDVPETIQGWYKKAIQYDLNR